MKILINVAGHYLGIEAGKDVGAILSALTGAKVYLKDWGNSKYRPMGTSDEPAPIKVEIVDDALFVAATPLIDKLTGELKDAENRWLEHYARANKAEAELAALKEKLAAIQPTEPKE